MSDEFTKFRSALKKEQRDLLDKILKIYSDECKKTVREEITTDQRHSSILNMCAFAFSENGPLAKTGYHFIRVEPLYEFRGEKGNKIFDLVLYNKAQKRAILIECKSSIGKPKAILNDLLEQIQNTENHKEELENEIGGEIEDFEYVICGIPHDIDELIKSIGDEPVCLWSADLFNFTLKMHNFTNSNDGDATGNLIRKRQLHLDKYLRESLYDKIESRGLIEGTLVTPLSHFCRILSRVFIKISQQVLFKSTGEEKRFWLNELIAVVQDELPEIGMTDIHRMSKLIYKHALKLKIIEIKQEKETPKAIEFGLKMAARNSRIVEQNIEDKYIEDICNERSPKLALTEYQTNAAKSKSSLDYHFNKIETESDN